MLLIPLKKKKKSPLPVNTGQPEQLAPRVLGL